LASPTIQSPLGKSCLTVSDGRIVALRRALDIWKGIVVLLKIAHELRLLLLLVELRELTHASEESFGLLVIIVPLLHVIAA
jgi:hypothetical protein